jgi:hypothetical protein
LWGLGAGGGGRRGGGVGGEAGTGGADALMPCAGDYGQQESAVTTSNTRSHLGRHSILWLSEGTTFLNASAC